MISDSGSKPPIFIHSLFRSGSTYLFNVFRRSAGGYWCYQEALHEYALHANEDPERLLFDHDDGWVKSMRHPILQEHYFQELYDVWPAWKDTLPDKAVYDGYFASHTEDVGLTFLQTLARVARGRPVFQECRTAGRIAPLKKVMGGTHLYLWRNPWDQWWSYKVSRYFDVANLLIISAPDLPPPIRLMRNALHVEILTQGGVHDKFSHYLNRFLTAEESYLVFYMLWCFGIREGLKEADLMLSIDRLSDAADYRSEILSGLQTAGIGDIDFSDCRVPQGHYLEDEGVFFSALEGKVHQWLREGGWSQQDIDQIQALRQQYRPLSWETPITDVEMLDQIEQASRARGAARRFETALAEYAGSMNRSLVQAEAKVRQEAQRAEEAEHQVGELRSALDMKNAELHAAQQANQHHLDLLQALRNELDGSHASNHAKSLVEEQLQLHIQALTTSTSWRITAPARWIGSLVRKMPLPGKMTRIAKDPIEHLVLYVALRPKLSRLARSILKPFPGVAAGLRGRRAIQMRSNFELRHGRLAREAPVASKELSGRGADDRAQFASLEGKLTIDEILARIRGEISQVRSEEQGAIKERA